MGPIADPGRRRRAWPRSGPPIGAAPREKQFGTVQARTSFFADQSRRIVRCESASQTSGSRQQIRPYPHCHDTDTTRGRVPGRFDNNVPPSPVSPPRRNHAATRELILWTRKIHSQVSLTFASRNGKRPPYHLSLTAEGGERLPACMGFAKVGPDTLTTLFRSRLCRSAGCISARDAGPNQAAETLLAVQNAENCRPFSPIDTDCRWYRQIR